MPGKSGRDKRSARNKRRLQRDFSVTRAQQSAATQRREPVSSVPAPSTRGVTPRPPLTSVYYPYIATELRRIAILGGIMLAVLIVLSLVIP